MRKLATGMAWVAALIATGACNDMLDVSNTNSPDVTRAYSTPAAVEQIISTLYQGIHTGLHGASGSLSPQMAVMSFASYGTVANFGMGTRASIPRTGIDNKRNNITDGENQRLCQSIIESQESEIRQMTAKLREMGEAGGK